MDPKELDDKIKEFIDKLPETEDYDKLFNEFTDTITQTEVESEGNQQDDLNYKLGYDAGFVEGFQQGQLLTNYDSDTVIYNEAIDNIVDLISSYDFQSKPEVLTLINNLRRA